MKRVRFFSLALTMGLVLGLPAISEAQDVYFFTVSDGEGIVGGTAEVEVTLDFADGEGIAGYSMAVCHDETVTSLGDDAIVNGTLVDDTGFIFHAASARDEGWTAGAGFSIGTSLDPDDGFQMYLVTYNGDAAGMSALEWCTIGESPSIEASVVLASDLSEIKVDGDLGVNDGSVNFTVEPFFKYRVVGDGDGDNRDHIGSYNAETGEINGVDCTFEDEKTEEEITVTTILVEFSVEEDADLSPTFPTTTEGLSMAVHHDGAIFRVCAAQPAGDMAELNNGNGPDFSGINIDPKATADPCPEGDDALRTPGWTVGVAFSFGGSASMAFDGELTVMSANYESVDAANFTFAEGAEVPVVVDLVFATIGNPLGCPAVENALIANGGDTSFDLTNETLAVKNGTITMLPVPPDLPFTRGDCNDDSILNIADAIFILNARFQPFETPSPLPSCAVACDVNSDGNSFEATDAIFILNYQFLDGPPPADPFGECEFEEAADCEEQASCDE